jgi:hypothetical protein
LVGCSGEAAGLPPSDFFVFGEGNRRKLLYRAGTLSDLASGEVVWRGAVTRETVRASETSVELIADGKPVRLFEDDSGVWVGNRRIVDGGAINRPRFSGPHAGRLRALHHEILVNIVDGKPLPNLFVYDRPWRRDAAIMAMALQQTGNIGLITPWITRLDTVFDGNAGFEEPDNIGQTLYLLALAGAREHPLVSKAIGEIGRFRRGDHIAGLTDGSKRAAYQTIWLKTGLQALNLPDPYVIPWRSDHYRSLAWWMPDGGLPFPLRFGSELSHQAPYLAWAEAHYWQSAPPTLPPEDAFPQSWEVNGAAADFRKMAAISKPWAQARFAGPHGWHAAEAFLYFLKVA